MTRIILGVICAQVCAAHANLRVSKFDDTHLLATDVNNSKFAHDMGDVHAMWQSQLVHKWAQVRDLSVRASELRTPSVISLIQTVQPILTPKEVPQVLTTRGELIEGAIHAIMASLLAFCYLRYRCVPAPGAQTGEQLSDWSTGCCDWYQEPGTAFTSCCCPAIRWAETLSEVTGLHNFWTAFAGFLILMSCARLLTLPIVSGFAWVVLSAVCAAYRQEFRRKFGFENQGGVTYLLDFLMHMCCVCCALTQEARHVEDALVRSNNVVQVPQGRQTSDSRRDCLTCLPFSEQKY